MDKLDAKQLPRPSSLARRNARLLEKKARQAKRAALLSTLCQERVRYGITLEDVAVSADVAEQHVSHVLAGRRVSLPVVRALQRLVAARRRARKQRREAASA